MKIELKRLASGVSYERNTARGTRHGRSKLTDYLVRKLRKEYADGESVVVLARRLGLHHSTIHDVVTGKTWSHVRADGTDSSSPGRR